MTRCLAYNAYECEDDYMRRPTHVTNVYVTSSTTPSGASGVQVADCKPPEEECREPTTVRSLPGFRSSPPLRRPPRKCEEETNQIESKRMRLKPTDPMDDVLEIQEVGFPEEFGQPTFEDMKNACTPSPFLKCIPPEEFAEGDRDEEENESTLPPKCREEPADPCCTIPNWWDPDRTEYYWIPSNIQNVYNYREIQHLAKTFAQNFAPTTPGIIGIPRIGVPNEVGQAFYYIVMAWLFRDNNPGRTSFDALLSTPVDPYLGTSARVAYIRPIATANWLTSVNPLTGVTFTTQLSMEWFLWWRNDVLWTINMSLPVTDAAFVIDSYFDTGWTIDNLATIYGWPTSAQLEGQWPYGGEQWCSANIPPMTGPNPLKIPKPAELDTYWNIAIFQDVYGGDKWKYYDEIFNWWFKDGDPPNNGVDTIFTPVHASDDHYTASDLDALEVWFFSERTLTPTYEACPSVSVCTRDVPIKFEEKENCCPVEELPPAGQGPFDGGEDEPPDANPAFPVDDEEEEEEEPLPEVPPIVEEPEPEPSQDEGPISRISDFTVTDEPTGNEMLMNQTTMSQNVTTVESQDPDGIKWISPDRWAAAEWDGKPLDVVNQTLDKKTICDFIRPSGNPHVMRGLREVFYRVNPFKDVKNPTPGEIQAWEIEVIKHFRNLLGITVPVFPDSRLYLESRWADERKYTTAWDIKYPATGAVGGPRGPCTDSTGKAVDTARGHCGASFFPNETDRMRYISQAPYMNDTITYPELTNYQTRRSKTEGIQTLNADIPWSIKLSIVIMRFVCTEGLTGHSGPFVGDPRVVEKERKYFGNSWWHVPGGREVIYRGKWA